MSGPLGLIPPWQFSADPKVNPMVNPHVSMPPGWYQAGVYTTQPAYNNGYTGEDRDNLGRSAPFNCLNCAPKMPFAGPQLGFVMIDEGEKPVGVPWGTIREGDMVFNRNVDYLTTGNGPSGLGFSLPSFPNPLEDYWLWRHRRGVMLAGAGVVGLMALSLIGSLVR